MFCISASQLIVGLGPYAMIYKVELNLNLIVLNFLNATWCSVLMTIYAMLLTYIVQIKAELEEIMNENVQLFDKMHEGVALVSESED